MALTNGLSERSVRLKLKHTNTTPIIQMKLKNLFTITVATLAIAFPAFAEEETPLGKEMEKVSKAMKAIGRASKEGKVTKDLASKVDEAKTAFEAAAKLEPAKLKEVPAADKAKFLTDYKASCEVAIKELAVLKAAIEAEKADDVAKSLEKLNTGKKEGHKAFKSE